jgi:hypothetical protein
VAYVKDLNGNTSSPNPNPIFPACQGDQQLKTYLGVNSCHEQVARINSNPEKSTGFIVGLVGARKPSPTTIVVRLGNTAYPCWIVGAGLEAAAGPDDAVATKKYETFGPCTLEETIPLTGPVTVEVTQDSDPACELLNPQGTDLKDVKLQLPGQDVFSGVQAQAFSFVTTGSPKCYSTVIPTPNGKLYTVCK